MSLELSRAEVEQVLALAYFVREDRRKAFGARLRHLQRHGVPPGTNTGKGKAAAYGWDQLLLLSVALEMLHLGMTPELASAIIKDNQLSIIEKIKASVTSIGKLRKVQIYMLLDPGGLSDLVNKWVDPKDEDDQLAFGKIDELPGRLLINPRIAVVDLYSMCLATIEGLEVVRPELRLGKELGRWATEKTREEIFNGSD